MPLSHGKSAKSFSHNVETEMHHGKPLKQSLAIAYAMKRKKKAHGGCMAEGGEMDDSMHDTENPVAKSVKKAFHAPGYAGGGMVHEEKASGYEHVPMPCENCGHVSHKEENQGATEHDDMEDDMIEHIMKKRKHYSHGGKVSNEDEPVADSEPAEYDDMEKDDHLEEHYSGKNSDDEDGDEAEDEDRRDVVSMIMKSRKKKDKMPRPA
jgi:hypothetical protein